MAKRKKSKPRSDKGTVAQRALGPAADKFGRAVAPLGKEVGEESVKVGRILLSAIKGMVWGLDRIGVWLGAAISARLKDTPKEKIVEPTPRIAVPAVQALVYSMQDEFIREMFANLIAADMNADKKGDVHPAFVELIKEMTPGDARVFSSVVARSQIRFRIGVRRDTWQHLDINFSFDVPEMDRRAIDFSVRNLVRLGLIEMRETEYPSSEEFEQREQAARDPFEKMVQGVATVPADWHEAIKALMSSGSKVEVVRSGIYVTGFGVDFWNTCMDK
jgi:Abortive infection alpha